jgi:hypothetical protein
LIVASPKDQGRAGKLAMADEQPVPIESVEQAGLIFSVERAAGIGGYGIEVSKFGNVDRHMGRPRFLCQRRCGRATYDGASPG